MMPRPANGILAAQKYSFYLLFVLKFPGMSVETPKMLNYLWECLSWFSVFVPLHMSFCFFKTVYDGFELESMDTLSNIGIQGVWLFCSSITMLNYKLKSKDLNDIIDTIEDEFLWRSAKGKTYVDMEKIHRCAKFVSMFWQFFPSFTVVGSLLRPLFNKPIDLPIPIWYPIDKKNPYQFALAYFLQAWAQIIVVCSFAVGSSFFYSFGLLCSGQFNITRCALKNLIFTSGVYKRFSETLSDNYEPDSGEYHLATERRDMNFARKRFESSENFLLKDIENIQPEASKDLCAKDIKKFRAALKKAVQHHYILIRLCGMMEKFLNFFALLRVLEVTLQMCFMAFVYVRTSDFFVLLFGVLAAVDLFLLTYPAEYISEQNNLIGSSLMMGPWYLVSKYFRNDFLIIIMFSQQPIQFTAGKILPLNADRLRQAITTAFSYYTLLSSFDEG
ncbi:odorant receptor 83a [Episyrphus balteatus]|uniref:odorant receptor 83a n=1 Tax=Episyrphus balteatus TaxID=286459 RepID=UPI002485AAAB|nr:odorant receptor 83a [Episyrphus balteatus]